MADVPLAQYPDRETARFIDAYLERLPAYLASMGRRLSRHRRPHSTDPGDVTVGLLTGNLSAGARVKLRHFGLHERFPFGGFGDHHWERDDVAFDALGGASTSRDQSRGANLGDRRYSWIRCARAIGARWPWLPAGTQLRCGGRRAGLAFERLYRSRAFLASARARTSCQRHFRLKE